MLIPAHKWTDKQLESFLRDYAEIEHRINSGEKMTPKKIREIVANNKFVTR